MSLLALTSWAVTFFSFRTYKLANSRLERGLSMILAICMVWISFNIEY